MGSAVVHIWSAFGHEWRLHGYWMWVNFVLAVAPAVGGFVLYHWWRYLYGIRWLLLVAIGLLLPNSPYVVTDLIHVHWMLATAATRLDRGAAMALLLVLIASGVMSYAYNLHLARRIMRRRGWSRRHRAAVEISIDGICAVGVALGRISRLNSWDILRPQHLAHGLVVLATDPRAIVLAAIIVVLADLPVDRLASGAVHTLQARLRHPH